ncbi:MAG: aminoacyl-tRNA hydrolase [Firmicutes bacterium]|nr:aminoacyl-tRNA hydrolase [Bacillota bacterium]
MWLLAGLGNPGPEYAPTRHNAGFWVLDRLAAAWGAPLRTDRRARAETARADVGGQPVLLCKPLTYMNESGRAVAHLARAHGIPVERIVVVHDDLDLPCGAVRLKRGGGTGGHHGLDSIAAHLGPEFGRVRIGIGRPEAGGADAVVRWVLGAPRPSERADLDRAVARAAEAVEAVLTQGWEAAMNVFNRR